METTATTTTPAASTTEQLDIAGAWLRHMVRSAFHRVNLPIPGQLEATDCDRDLIEYAVQNCKFNGPIGWDGSKHSAGHWLSNELVTNSTHGKWLLDGMSGQGQEAVPVELDDCLMAKSLLNDETLSYIASKNANVVEGVNGRDPRFSLPDYVSTPVRVVVDTGCVTRDAAATIVESISKALCREYNSAAERIALGLIRGTKQEGTQHIYVYRQLGYSVCVFPEKTFLARKNNLLATFGAEIYSVAAIKE